MKIVLKFHVPIFHNSKEIKKNEVYDYSITKTELLHYFNSVVSYVQELETGPVRRFQ